VETPHWYLAVCTHANAVLASTAMATMLANTCPAALLAVVALAAMLTDANPAALLAPITLAAMLADTGPATLPTAVPPATMLADATPAALLALAAHATMLTDAGPAALLAVVPSPAMHAHAGPAAHLAVAALTAMVTDTSPTTLLAAVAWATVGAGLACLRHNLGGCASDSGAVHRGGGSIAHIPATLHARHRYNSSLGNGTRRRGVGGIRGSIIPPRCAWWRHSISTSHWRRQRAIQHARYL